MLSSPVTELNCFNTNDLAEVGAVVASSASQALTDSLSESVPEMAVGTALKILERESYISRPKEKTASSFLKLKTTWPELIASISPRAKTQLSIMKELQVKYAKEITKGWEFNLDDISLILKLKKNSLLRVFKKLAENNLLEYRPPWRGTEVKVLKVVEPEDLNLDFKALKDKATRAYEKLDEMENYVHQLGCRQEYILRYFGDSQAAPCGRCDNCLKRRRYRNKTGIDYLHKEYLS